MKKLLLGFAICSGFAFKGQPGMYRQYTQPSPPPNVSWEANVQTPKPTGDGGYLLSNWFYYMGFESPGGLGSSYTIKTDSAFIPQWKKNYPGAIPLPTGGIILFGGNVIEKVTASGAQVWIKHLASPIHLSDAVLFGDKIRYVGIQVTHMYVPFTTMSAYTSDGFTMLSDTSGGYISHALLHSSLVNTVSLSSWTYRASADFSKIERDASGNFFVYSSARTMAGIGSSMAIAKFDSNFTFVWGKSWATNTHNVRITDIDILPNGRIFAAAVTTGNTNIYWASRAALLKFSSQGDLVSQCYFESRFLPGGMVKKANGNYVVSMQANDSLFMTEADTSMNISWYKFVAKGASIGGSVIRNNRLHTPLQYGKNLVLISNDINGNSCASYLMSYTKPATAIVLTNFVLSPITYSTALVTGTVNNIDSQSYIDSCKCPVFIPTMLNNVCVGNTASVNISGTGNLSWYGSATGNDFIMSGPQFTFSSMTPTILTVYAQDSACSINPNRTQVNFSVQAVPSLSFSPASPSLCIGHQIFLYVGGAPSYTWSHNLPSSYVQNLNPQATTVYTVTGSAAPGCSDTKTVALTVVPPPTITAVSSGSMCLGQTATLSAIGGISYSWNGGSTAAVFTVSPAFPGHFTYNVAGSNGVCNGYSSASVLVVAIPNVSVMSNPSVVCLGKTTTIVASGASTYSWSNGWVAPGFTSTPSANTVYVVTGSNSGCTSTAAVNISVQVPPVVTAAASTQTVCAGSAVTFSAFGATSYSWTNGPSEASFSQNMPVGITSYSVTGIDGVCSASAVVMVQGVPAPTVVIFSSPLVPCAGSTATVTAHGATSYTWTNGPMGNTFITSPLSAGPTTFAVLGSAGSCTGIAQSTLLVIPGPTVSVVSTDSSICTGKTATLTASGASTYSWNGIIGGATHVVSPSVSTTYVVMGDGAGCTASTVFNLVVQPLPTISIVAPTEAVCVGTPLSLIATGAATYTWSNGFNTPSITFTAQLGSSAYSVTGSALGCTAMAATNIQGVSQPVIMVTTNPSLICAGMAVTVTASGAPSYTWNNSATDSALILTPSGNTTLSVYGANGSCGVTEVFTLPVHPIPTVTIVSDKPVSCNGDQVNLQAAGANTYTWNTGATTATISPAPPVSITYSVFGMSQEGCSSTAYHYQPVNPCTGIDIRQVEEIKIDIYPNPNNGSFVIASSSSCQNKMAQLLGVDGKILFSTQLAATITVFNVQPLAKGIYVLKVPGVGFVKKILVE